MAVGLDDDFNCKRRLRYGRDQPFNRWLGLGQVGYHVMSTKLGRPTS